MDLFGDGTVINDDFINVNYCRQISTYTFTEAGTYNVTLSVDTECGIDPFSKEICIEPEITPTFTVDNEDGCIPMNVITTNTTDESDLCVIQHRIEWSVNSFI